MVVLPKTSKPASISVMTVIAVFRRVEVDCYNVGILGATTTRAHEDHSRIPIPRVMKVKFIPRFLSTSTQPPLVTLHKETSPQMSILNPTGIPYGNLSLEQKTADGGNCSKPAPGALAALLSRDPEVADQCVSSENDATKIGVITCPCCKRKIQINIQLNKLLEGNDTSKTNKSREIVNIDYHSNS